MKSPNVSTGHAPSVTLSTAQLNESPLKYPLCVLYEPDYCLWGLLELSISYAIHNMSQQLVLPIPSPAYF